MITVEKLKELDPKTKIFRNLGPVWDYKDVKDSKGNVEIHLILPDDKYNVFDSDIVTVGELLDFAKSLGQSDMKLIWVDTQIPVQAIIFELDGTVSYFE